MAFYYHRICHYNINCQIWQKVQCFHNNWEVWRSILLKCSYDYTVVLWDWLIYICINHISVTYILLNARPLAGMYTNRPVHSLCTMSIYLYIHHRICRKQCPFHAITAKQSKIWQIRFLKYLYDTNVHIISPDADIATILKNIERHTTHAIASWPNPKQ